MLSFLLFLMIITNKLSAQSMVQIDSIRAIAYTDAKKFKLSSEDLKTFKKNKKTTYKSSSDHFKPDTVLASNKNLLNDSTYVQAFREEAFTLTKKRTPGHYLPWIISISLFIVIFIGV